MVYFCWCPFVGIAAIGGQSGLELGVFNNGDRTASWASIPPYTGANWKLVSVDFLRASFTAQVAYAQLGALMGVALCSVAPPHLHVASAIGCDRDVAEGDAEAYGT
jgi:hypothetical protein